MKTYRVSTQIGSDSECLLHTSPLDNKPIETMILADAEIVFAREAAYLDAAYKQMSNMGHFSDHLYDKYVIRCELTELVFDEDGDLFDAKTIKTTPDYYNDGL